ncbi:MAG: hypothetical protein PHV20_12075 [Bacteroidales bacterium]|nr:hypothetical protein [Bacteroidales bacterium]
MKNESIKVPLEVPVQTPKEVPVITPQKAPLIDPKAKSKNELGKKE